MHVLRRAWPLAAALFVTLASAPIASGDDTTSALPAAGDKETTWPTDGIRLFGQTWCFGSGPHSVPCDFTVPPARTGPPAISAPARTDRPLERVMSALKKIFTGTPTAPAAQPETNRG